MGKGQTKHVVVVVDHSTKWVEAKPSAKITEAQIISFVWTNIICWFDIPKAIVTDNGMKFDNVKFKELCSKLSITHLSSSPSHRQANE